MRTAELLDVPVLAARLAAGDVRAVDVVDAQLERLRAVDAATGCVAAWTDGARAAAAALDASRAGPAPVGALHGVPFTAKDWIDAAGLPCTGGDPAHRERRPDADATAVARMRAAGALLLAKTAVLADGELFGRVRNPHDPERSPGASSSGEAAAVGGGGSPVGLASDSGGSIRLPAAWCGAVGLKPTAGRVPTTGHFPRVGERSDGRTQIGVMGSSVRNVAAALAVVAGPDGLDPACAPVPLGAHSAIDVASLRVGSHLGDAAWEPDAGIAAAVEQSLAALVARGARPVGDVPQHLDEALDVTQRYWQRKGAAAGMHDVERQLRDWDRYRRRMLLAMRDVDAVVLPATRTVAPRHRPIVGADYVYLLPASLTGWPAVAVPVGRDAAGLPVAVQVVAPPWRDDVALAVAAVVEPDPPLAVSGARVRAG